MKMSGKVFLFLVCLLATFMAGLKARELKDKGAMYQPQTYPGFPGLPSAPIFGGGSGFPSFGGGGQPFFGTIPGMPGVPGASTNNGQHAATP